MGMKTSFNAFVLSQAGCEISSCQSFFSVAIFTLLVFWGHSGLSKGHTGSMKNGPTGDLLHIHPPIEKVLRSPNS
jgi:hypothetical protein